ncbi:MAG TPA: ABC transporter ATP-binding protein [Candidatus Moranbacteria bacterium]|nr:ABC transporter ATP-binding protein [Candidatus Moranbacteria bacterium]
MNKPLVEIKNLKVIYNKGKSNEVRALDGVNLKIYPQEYVIFYGPSGCGKSTLLYAISGLQAPTQGETYFRGKDISKMTKEEMVGLHQKGTGMVFQAFYLIPSLNVLDNVCLPKVFRGESLGRRKEEGIKLLHRFSIVEQANKFPSQLSGGQKQRVSISRALVNNPELILADEPVGNLDSESAENVLQILKELNEIDKKTVILVTHNAEHLHFADRVIYMKDGRIIKEEVNKEKRPLEAGKEDIDIKLDELSDEMKILMRAFKNLSITQVGALLVPYKANQLMAHLISELTEEQVNSANAFLKELLFYNINLDDFRKSLDLSYNKGGAGWNKKRAESFSRRAGEIIKHSEIIKKEESKTAAISLSEYFANLFSLHLDGEIKLRLESFVKQRIENKIDRFEFQKKLDSSKILGGVGLNRLKAEKISREMEIIMLIKFSN